MFNDEVTAERILSSDDPKEHKRLGYTVAGLQKHIWEAKRDTIMRNALEAKYEQCEHCKTFLRNTKSNRLVEANPSDRYWGVGLSVRDQAIWDFRKWKGSNRLGEMLMEIRETLK